MPIAAHVVHPAPLTCRHRTPGQVRVDFAQVRTEVAIPEFAAPVPLRVTAPAAPGGAPRADVFHVHDGALWRRLSAPLPEFLEHLSNPERHVRSHLGREIGFHLPRTPLHALWRDGPSRGDPPGVRKVRSILHDGTERARGDLRDFVRRSVRVDGNTVYLRCPGPFALHAGSGTSPSFVLSVDPFRFSDVGSLASSERIVSPRVGRAAAFWAFELAFYQAHAPARLRGRSASAPFRIDMRGLQDAAGLGDPLEDVLNFANDAPEATLANVPDRAFRSAAVTGAAERLHRWVALGRTRSIRLEEAETAILDARALSEALAESECPVGIPLPVAKLTAYGREIALPLLRGVAPQPPREDEESLSILGR